MVRSSCISAAVAVGQGGWVGGGGWRQGFSVDEDIDLLFIPAGDPKTWQNKSLPGDPNYLVGANCVSVLIDHF